MRINWVKQFGIVGFFIMLIFLAIWNKHYLTMRGLSLGEPDPMALVLMGAIFAFTSTYAAIYWAENKTILGITTSKPVRLHNVDEFKNIVPGVDIPQKWIDQYWDSYNEIKEYNETHKEQLELPSHPELATGPYKMYVGGGYRIIRARGRGDGQVLFIPAALVSKHFRYVDFLGEERVYEGLDHSEVPLWVLDCCIKYVPGFVPGGTEIIFADRPNKYAVKAWDADRKEFVYCRCIHDTEIDYEGRNTYLKKYSESLANECANGEKRNRKERAARTKKRAKPAPAPAPAPANTGGQA